MRVSNEEIVRGNVLIALFLGWKIDNSFPDKDRIYRSPKNYIELDTTMKFHTSFDLLIPIALKVNDWGFANIGHEGFMNSDFEPIVINHEKFQMWLNIVKNIEIINKF